LQTVRNNDIGCNSFLVFLSSIVGESLKDFRKNTLSSQGVSMVMYGLQGMHSSSSELCTLLKVLALNILYCTDHFIAQTVGIALYGMQRMSSDSAEVRAMLSALAPKVESCREALDAQHVGNAL
jgi:hypothetical protein